MIYALKSPLRIAVTKKPKYFVLNLNQYRNTHFQVLNKAKRDYKTLMKAQIAQLPKMDKISLKFVMYPRSKHLMDTSNVCCIHEKFFNDALTEMGIIEDDNYKFVIETSYSFGEIDKIDPRVIIYITEVK